MSLSTQVSQRYSNEKLTRLTNPDNRVATAPDGTRLGLAATDAQAEFIRRTAVAYDETEPHHVDVAVELVVLKLMERGGATAEATQAQRERVESQFESLARVLGRDRPPPKTTGQNLTLTPEVEAGRDVRPKFDRRYTDGYIAQRPGG